MLLLCVITLAKARQRDGENDARIVVRAQQLLEEGHRRARDGDLDMALPAYEQCRHPHAKIPLLSTHPAAANSACPTIKDGGHSWKEGVSGLPLYPPDRPVSARAEVGGLPWYALQ